MATVRDDLPISRYQYVRFISRGREQSRYRDTRTGRYVPEARVRNEIDHYIDSVGRQQARQLATDLRAGNVSLAEWQQGMKEMIRNVHYANVAAASGGVRNMTNVERGRVGGYVANQLRYLRRFANQIASGEQPLNGVVDRRCDMYAQAGRGSYYDERRAATAQRYPGKRLIVKSNRAPGDSCDDCISLDGRWFSIDDPNYKPIGKRVCLTACRCSEEIGFEGEVD